MDHHKPHWSQGYPLRFNIGLTISLALVLAAFEWKSPEGTQIVQFDLEASPEAVLEMRVTDQQPPKPVIKVQTYEIVEVPDDTEDLLDDPTIAFEDIQPGEVALVKPNKSETAMVEEVVDEPISIVEENATPVGGYEAFYKYVRKELKYPSQARRMGVEGKVYVQFVIERDGSLSDVKVIKGIGAGCDEEASRVISSSPRWQPGKQRGRPVRQRMVLPLTFKLG